MITRRQFLRGLGTVAVSLPFLDGMVGAAVASGATGAGAGGEAPKRLITVFFSNGCPPPLWLPEGRGGDFVFDRALAPLEPLRDKIALVSGLHDPAAKEGSGDDHSRGSGAFAVGAPNPFLEADAFDASGKRYASSAGGPSLEQFALQQLRPDTLLPSLEVGVMRGAPFTRTYHIKSWRGVNQPNPSILNPLDTFHRIFGRDEPKEGDDYERERRYRRSVLDTVLPEYHRVTSDRYGLDGASRAMIADHLDGVRELERRALRQDAEMLGSCLKPEAPASYAELRYSQFAEVFKLQAELLAVALRCDVTRFASVMLGAGAEGFKLPGLERAHHELGHQWMSTPDNDFIRYTRFQMELIAHLLRALDAPSFLEANGKTVLDNSVVLIGTELSNPSRHDHDEMLYLVAGGAGSVKTKYHHRVGAGDDRPANDLYTACLRAVGVPARRFGASRFNTEPLDLA